MFTDDLDLSEYNPETVEAVAASGGLIPPGKYHARLDGSREHKAKSGTEGTELVFTILAGPFAGQEVKETLWKTDNDRGKNRAVLFAHRLGLLTLDPKTKKYARVQGKGGFEDCLGAQVVIEVEHQEYERKEGGKGHAVRLTFGGIFAVDDPKVKDVAKASKAAKPVPPAKPKVDTSEL